MAAAMGFGCTKVTDSSDHKFFELGVRAASEDTKTTISGKTISWSTGDYIGVYANGFQDNAQFSFSSGNTFKGLFEVTDRKGSDVEFYSYYPYCESDGTVVSSTLQTNQTAPFDARCNFMVADKFIADYDEDNMPPITFNFANQLFAIVRLSFTNSVGEYAGEKLSKVVLQAPGAVIAGAFTFDASQGRACNPVFSGTSYDKVTVSYPAAQQPEMSVGETRQVYAIVKAGTFDKILMTVYTTNYSITKESSSSVTFERNVISNLPALDFGKMLKSLSASIDDLGEYDYPESGFWKL